MCLSNWKYICAAVLWPGIHIILILVILLNRERDAWRHPGAVCGLCVCISVILYICVIPCVCMHMCMLGGWHYGWEKAVGTKEAPPITTQTHVHKLQNLETHKHIHGQAETQGWGGLWGHNLACRLTITPSSGRSLTGRSLSSPPPWSVLSQLLWGDSGGGWYRMLANKKKIIPKT